MKKSEVLESIVNASTASPAKKLVAQDIIDSAKPLENGGASSVETISRHLVNLTRLLIPIYLQDDAREQVLVEIAKHTAGCQKRSTPRRYPIPENARQLGMSMLYRIPWPGAAIIIAIIYRDDIRMIAKAIIGG